MGFAFPSEWTVTGGLPYFGGPGNNYTTHALATMLDRLRADGGLGLVTGLGWFVTKHSLGLYGTRPPPNGFVAAGTEAGQRAIDETALEVALEAQGEALVVAATVTYDGDGKATGAPVIAELRDRRRIVAAFADDPNQLAGVNLVGAQVRVGGRPPRYHL